MLVLVPFLACSGPPSDPKGTGDTAPSEDTTSDTAETGETGETGGDTAPDTADTTDTADTGETGDTGEPPNPTAAECFAAQAPESGIPLVDYDQFGPVVGTHCKGTDHQELGLVEHVVFVGDSVALGTPPTDASDWYRNLLAVEFAARYGWDEPSWSWQNVDPINGIAWEQDSGNFSVCAKWGARTDDMTDKPHMQLQTCIPEDRRSEATLVVMTVGGNDLFAWAQDLVDGMGEAELWAQAEQAVLDLEESVHWLTDDPTMFPAGLFVVFANTFEFTDEDSGNDFATCPGADLISMDTALVDPTFTALATWTMEQYMRIAVETGTDIAFMGEATCGHGYMYDQPDGRCYRGSGAELWLDVTCMHPGAAGHAGIADLFLAVIDE